MFGKAITYKTTKKCLADNRTVKHEASVGPDENLPPSVRRISKTLHMVVYLCVLGVPLTDKYIKATGLKFLK